jgi:cystathionine gamma-synthase
VKFGTRAVHAGLQPDPSYGSVIPAIHQTSTFAQPAVGQFVEDYDYARSANPTRAALEAALGELEGGLGSSFSSGMAATHALITAVCSAGDHVVLPSDLYGGTYRLVDKVLTRFGITYTLVDRPTWPPSRPRSPRRRGSCGSRRRPTPCSTSSTCAR